MIHWALAYIEKDRFQEVEAERIAEGGESTPKMNTNVPDYKLVWQLPSVPGGQGHSLNSSIISSGPVPSCL